MCDRYSFFMQQARCTLCLRLCPLKNDTKGWLCIIGIIAAYMKWVIVR